MTVKELKSILSKYDDDLLVVMSSDAEGNGYGELFAINDNSTFDGETIGVQNLTPKLKAKGYTEEDLGSGNPCIVLYP